MIESIFLNKIDTRAQQTERAQLKCADVGRDVVPNVPDLFGGIALGQIRLTWRRADRVSPGYSSFARRAEKKWDAEDSLPPSGILAVIAVKVISGDLR
jgi:hypothetical protein